MEWTDGRSDRQSANATYWTDLFDTHPINSGNIPNHQPYKWNRGLILKTSYKFLYVSKGKLTDFAAILLPKIAGNEIYIYYGTT